MRFSGYLPLYMGASAFDFGPDRSVRLVGHAPKVGQNEVDCSSVCEWDRNFQSCYRYVLLSNLGLAVPNMGQMSKSGTFPYNVIYSYGSAVLSSLYTWKGDRSYRKMFGKDFHGTWEYRPASGPVFLRSADHVSLTSFRKVKILKKGLKRAANAQCSWVITHGLGCSPLSLQKTFNFSFFTIFNPLVQFLQQF